MITFACPSCKKKIQITDDLAGMQGDCPFCKKIITAPGKKPDEAGGPVDVARCLKCGARRQEMKKSCGFCGNPFDGPSPTSTPATSGATAASPKITRRIKIETEASSGSSDDVGSAKRKLILLGLLGVLGAVAVGMYFFSGDSGPDNSALLPDDLCRRNLIGMHFAMQEYQTAKGEIPASTGSQFWVQILSRDGRTGMLKCPAGSGKPRPSHYRGPAKTFKELGDTGILATTFPDDHAGGINILLKNGTVLFAPADSETFKKAMAESKE